LNLALEWSASAEGCFLQSADGSNFIDVFRQLRLTYIITEFNSVSNVERDHILPRGMMLPFSSYPLFRSKV